MEIDKPMNDESEWGGRSPTEHDEDTGDYVVKLRGLPWSATSKDIMMFLKDCHPRNGEDSVHFVFTKDGRPSGECFVEFSSNEEVERALRYNNEHMGKRYIEVDRSKTSQMEWICKRMGPRDIQEGDSVVRLRGLPYGCSQQDIETFFNGLEIASYGITITLDQDGRCTGDAYVQFKTPDIAAAALQKHKEKIGHRYIEIFKSSKADIKYVVGPKPKPLMSLRPSPYDRPSSANQGGGDSYRARGRGFDPIDDGYLDSYDDYSSQGSFGAIGSRGRPRGSRSSSSGSSRGSSNGRQKSDNRMVVSNSSTGHSIHMRGLPFEATDKDIYQFLSPLNPVSVRLLREPNGRAKGEADVDFGTHEDAVAAMQKDRQNIGHRYIELFIQSTPGGSSSWKQGGGNSGYGGPPRGGSSYSNMNRSGGGGGGRGDNRGFDGGQGGYKDGARGGYGSYGGGFGDDHGSRQGYGGDSHGASGGSNVYHESSGGYNQGGRGNDYNQSGYSNSNAGFGQQQQQQQQPIGSGASYSGNQGLGASSSNSRGGYDQSNYGQGNNTGGQYGGNYQSNAPAPSSDVYANQASTGYSQAPTAGGTFSSDNFFGHTSY